MLTPFSRGRRARWGAGGQAAARRYPGDELFPQPRWGWTHAVQVKVPAAEIHPEWAAREGGELRLHPKAPPLRIVSVQPGRALVAYMAPVPALRDARQPGAPYPGGPARAGDRWMTASWLFLVEPVALAGCRVISRYRCGTSADLSSRLQFDPPSSSPSASRWTAAC